MPKLHCRDYRGRFCGIYLVFNSDYEAEQFNDRWLFGKFPLACWNGFLNAIAIWETWD